MPLAAFLISIAGTVAGRALLSLGIGWVVYAGFDTFASSLGTAINAQLGSLSPSVLAVLGLAGFPAALGIILGAFGARAALAGIARLGRTV